MINKISNWEDSLNQNIVDTSSTESDIVLEQQEIKNIQWEKDRQKSEDLDEVNSLRSKLLDRPTVEQMRGMTKFYESIDRKLFEIEYTCLPDYDEHHQGNKRRDYLQRRMENLIEIFETKWDENFLLKSNKNLAESIWLKNEIRWTFNQWIFHLTDIYNDSKLGEQEKLIQMRSSVIFLKSLLWRNIDL